MAKEKSGPKEASEEAQNTAEDAGQQASDNGGGLISDLLGSFRDSAGETLKPVIADATKTVAQTAIQKGPELIKDKVMPMIDEAGGPAALAKNALGGAGGMMGQVTEKIPGMGGGDGEEKKPEGHGRGRRLPVQEHVDVAVSLEVAYDQFTQFEEFPNFMHRVEKIEQRDDETLMWHENIWGVRRSWESKIVEQFPCERIVWRSDSPQTVGVVTFHKLSENLTRVYVNLDFQPQGLFEKSASGFRISRRALKSDLKRFKAYVEMKNEPSGSWRGVIEGGEVSESPEEREEQEQEQEQEDAEAREDEEPEAEEEPDEEDEEAEEPEAEEEPDEEDEEAEEPEAEEEPEEEKPKRQPRSRAKSSAKSSSSKAKAKPKAQSKGSRSRSKAKAGSRS